MGREVRKVPADWQHPKYPQDYYEPHLRGRLIGLHEGGYADAVIEWDECWSQWQRGLTEQYGADAKWGPIDPEYAGMRYTEYAGPRPSPDDYMPDWPEADRTHLMMYETTSEGTPLSPAFLTAEQLAHWLADNGASAFGSDTATYEQWLRMIGQGFAPSAVFSTETGLISGVAASVMP